MTYRHVDDPSGRSPGAEVSVDPVDGWVWVHQVPTTRRAMPVVLMPVALAREVALAILSDTDPGGCTWWAASLCPPSHWLPGDLRDDAAAEACPQRDTHLGQRSHVLGRSLGG